MENNKTVIEINGIKLEVGLTTAKRIDNFRVGDPVKVLKKEYSEHKVFPGVIIAFENFSSLPTIVVAYLDISYSGADVKYAYYNAESQNTEIVQSTLNDIPFSKATVIELMEKEITKKETELLELRAKKEFFLNNFNRYFKEFAE